MLIASFGSRSDEFKSTTCCTESFGHSPMDFVTKVRWHSIVRLLLTRDELDRDSLLTIFVSCNTSFSTVPSCLLMLPQQQPSFERPPSSTQCCSPTGVGEDGTERAGEEQLGDCRYGGWLFSGGLLSHVPAAAGSDGVDGVVRDDCWLKREVLLELGVGKLRDRLVPLFIIRTFFWVWSGNDKLFNKD